MTQITEKKVALVTGGGRGIGFAVARQLGRDGYAVAVTGRSAEEKYADNLALLAQDGTTYLYCRGDNADAAARESVLEAVWARFGRLDALVNNAGVAPLQRTDLLEMTEESFDRVVGINTKGNLFFTQAAVKRMLSQSWDGVSRRGVIVNISSCSAEVSSTGRGEYCVSKAGVSMLTKLFADRLAGEGILVHEVRPGIIATDMTAGVKAKYDALLAAGVFPLARWGTPEDVAGAVSALCSDKFNYTTGDYIDVDGGFHLKRL